MRAAISNIIFLVSALLAFLDNFPCIKGDSDRYIRGSNHLQEAWIFPGKEPVGFRLRWSKSPSWADLWTLLSNGGFYTMGRLCVRGVFIIYQEPHFQVSSLDAFEIVSGNIRCKKIPETTKSIQPVGSLGKLGFPSITFFEKPHFGSIAYPTTVNQGSYFFSKMDQTHSAIIIGRSPWTIQMSDGFRFCVQPDFDSKAKKPICLIKSFQSLLMLMDNPSIQFVKVTYGCENVDDENVHKIQDCMYYGKAPVPDDDQKGDSDTNDDSSSNSGKQQGRTLEEGGHDICSNDEKKELVFKLYKGAITGALDTDLNVEWPKLGRNAWRLELLDMIFTIVMDTISPSLITPNFFSRTREIFVQKLATVWGNDTVEEIDLPRSQQDYDTLISFTTDCVDRIESMNLDENYLKVMQNAWETIQTAKDFKGKINSEFERRPKLDIITEMVWIAGHIVGELCFILGEKGGPFWALYYNLFYHWYMLPVVPEWKKPTEGLNLIFGGIDYKVEYNKYAMFASLLLQNKLMEFLKRPPALAEEDQPEEDEEV